MTRARPSSPHRAWRRRSERRKGPRLTSEQVKKMALEGVRLVREPTEKERREFKGAIETQGWYVFPNVFVPGARCGILDHYVGAFDKVCPKWYQKGFNGSHRCKIIKAYGLGTCHWGAWIARAAYVQFLQLLTGDHRHFVVSLDAAALSLGVDEKNKSSLLPHTDVSGGSPSAELERQRLEAGEPFPCLQGQINLYTDRCGGTQLLFGPKIGYDNLPENNGKDYTPSPHPITTPAPVKTGSIVVWASDTVHGTKTKEADYPRKRVVFEPSGRPRARDSGGSTEVLSTAPPEVGFSDVVRIAQFVCAYPAEYRPEAERRKKYRRFMEGTSTGHLPTKCVPGGGRKHMSNSLQRKDTYCTPLPLPNDPEFIAFASSMI